MSVSFNKCN